MVLFSWPQTAEPPRSRHQKYIQISWLQSPIQRSKRIHSFAGRSFLYFSCLPSLCTSSSTTFASPDPDIVPESPSITSTMAFVAPVGSTFSVSTSTKACTVSSLQSIPCAFRVHSFDLHVSHIHGVFVVFLIHVEPCQLLPILGHEEGQPRGAPAGVRSGVGVRRLL